MTGDPEGSGPPFKKTEVQDRVSPSVDRERKRLNKRKHKDHVRIPLLLDDDQRELITGSGVTSRYSQVKTGTFRF